MSQVQGTSSETDLAVGTLQWNVLFAAALCPPSRGLAPSPKRSPRGSGPKATMGLAFFVCIWDSPSTPSWGWRRRQIAPLH